MTAKHLQGLIEFMRLADRLKRVRRQGWIDRRVLEPESSADHSWAVALFAWLLALDRAELDSDRIMLLALVHDLPEALAGDATPFDRHRDQTGQIPPDYFRDAPPAYDATESQHKQEREQTALRDMTAGLPVDLANQIVAAWSEYSSQASPEARFVRQVDKLETLLQAELYREAQPEIVIDSFRSGTDRDIHDPVLRHVLEQVLSAHTDAESEDEDNDQ